MANNHASHIRASRLFYYNSVGLLPWRTEQAPSYLSHLRRRLIQIQQDLTSCYRDSFPGTCCGYQAHIDANSTKEAASPFPTWYRFIRQPKLSYRYAHGSGAFALRAGQTKQGPEYPFVLEDMCVGCTRNIWKPVQ